MLPTPRFCVSCTAITCHICSSCLFESRRHALNADPANNLFYALLWVLAEVKHLSLSLYVRLPQTDPRPPRRTPLDRAYPSLLVAFVELPNLTELRFEPASSSADYRFERDDDATAIAQLAMHNRLQVLEFGNTLRITTMATLIRLLAAPRLHTLGGIGVVHWTRRPDLEVQARALTSLTTSFIDSELLSDLRACGVQLRELTMANEDPVYCANRHHFPHGLLAMTTLTKLTVTYQSTGAWNVKYAVAALPLLRDGTFERLGTSQRLHRLTLTSASLTRLSLRGCSSLGLLRLRGSLSSQLQHLDLRATKIRLATYRHAVQFGEIPTLLLDPSGIGQPQELRWLIDTNSEVQLPEQSKRRILSLIARYRWTILYPLHRSLHHHHCLHRCQCRPQVFLLVLYFDRSVEPLMILSARRVLSCQ